jgi:hypothetical protein
LASPAAATTLASGCYWIEYLVVDTCQTTALSEASGCCLPVVPGFTGWASLPSFSEAGIVPPTSCQATTPTILSFQIADGYDCVFLYSAVLQEGAPPTCDIEFDSTTTIGFTAPFADDIRIVVSCGGASCIPITNDDTCTT